MYLLNRAYLQTRQFDNAMRTFKRLEVLAPESIWVHVLRGQASDGVGAYPAAVEEFEAAKRLQPGDALVRFSLGFMYWKVRRYHEAQAELKEALRLDPRIPASLVLSGRLLSERRQPG